jgi:hypothetical protein
VEKIPGGAIEDSRVLKGVMFEKDVVVPARMRRWVRGRGGGRQGGAGVGVGERASCLRRAWWCPYVLRRCVVLGGRWEVCLVQAWGEKYAGCGCEVDWWIV